MVIYIGESGMKIDNTFLSYPLQEDMMTSIFGHGRIYTEELKLIGEEPIALKKIIWDESGIDLTYHNDKLVGYMINFEDNREERVQDGKKSETNPKCQFNGEVFVGTQKLDQLNYVEEYKVGDYILGQSRIVVFYNDTHDIREVFVRIERKRAEAKNKLNINMVRNGISIDGEIFEYPINPLEIKKKIAKYPDTVSEEDAKFDNGIMIKTDQAGDFKECFIDMNYYDGVILADGNDFSKIKLKKSGYNIESGIIGDSKLTIAYFSDHQKGIREITISRFQSALVEKYKIPKVQGEVLQFKDLNFKLAVLQVLMYDKELLQPKFDLSEFAEQYQKSDIDLDSEEAIPEVLNYFKKYPIEKKYAEEITELYQDGGDDIYLQVAPCWDGEDDQFVIKSEKDAIQFSNLRKVTLFLGAKSIIKKFEALGVQAEWL
jgi:hypothetical protein